MVLIFWIGDAACGQIQRLPVPTEPHVAAPQQAWPPGTTQFAVSQQVFTDNGAYNGPNSDIMQTGWTEVGGVVPTACTQCEQSWLGPLPARSADDTALFCSSCSGGCVPGQHACESRAPRTRIGRFAYGLYRALCCPDPCYDPKWLALADSAFFVEAARPQTQQRLRWDAGLDAVLADRAEYFWARADGNGKGPRPKTGYLAIQDLTYHELSLYTEVGSSGFSMFTNMPYRSLYPTGADHSAGFSDIDMGTKSLLFDCELLQVSFQFRTHLPTANSTKGLSTGHVSLEPSLLVGLNLGPETYFQGQIAERIPIAGDTHYAGAILHYHAAINHILWRPLTDVPLIGTVELSGWSFQDGAYTDPATGLMQSASGETTVTVGPGLRLVVCDRIDFGTGVAFAMQDRRLANVLVRSEFRWRY